MSVVVETFIMCDHCNCNFGIDTRGLTAAQHRKNAKKDGWTQQGKKDFCELCSQIRNKTGRDAFKKSGN
jgi:hypothetical protein